MDDPLLRILLIDDDEDTFILSRGLLSQAGLPRCELNWSESYEDGLDRILKGQHDAYLIDYHLGERDGLELIKDAVSRGCRAPLILLTGQEDRSVDLEAMRAGAAELVVEDGENGILMPTGDAPALAAALESLLSDPASIADGQTILRAPSPRGPLGLVIWIDNQWMVATPEGRFGHGVLALDHAQWLEVADVTIE